MHIYTINCCFSIMHWFIELLLFFCVCVGGKYRMVSHQYTKLILSIVLNHLWQVSPTSSVCCWECVCVCVGKYAYDIIINLSQEGVPGFPKILETHGLLCIYHLSLY